MYESHMSLDCHEGESVTEFFIFLVKLPLFNLSTSHFSTAKMYDKQLLQLKV